MRLQSQIKAEKAYQAKIDRVIIRFKKNSPLWEWVRSQVTHQSEIPAYIKQVLEKEKNREQA